MAGSLFRLACNAEVLRNAPKGWVSTMLQEGELALLLDDSGLDAVTALAHALDLVTVPLLRAEETIERQASTVMAYAGSKPLIWVAASFTDSARTWAHVRGPMTLLVQTQAALSDDERKRVERFVIILGRQAE